MRLCNRHRGTEGVITRKDNESNEGKHAQRQECSAGYLIDCSTQTVGSGIRTSEDIVEGFGFPQFLSPLRK